MTHSDFELYTLWIYPRVGEWGHTHNNGWAVKWSGCFPRGRVSYLGVDASVNLLRLLGINDVGPFITVCREQGWAVI